MKAGNAGLITGTLDVLAGTPAAMRALVGTLPGELATRGADDDWSPRDVVAHVLSVEPWALAHRVRLMLGEDDPAIPSVDESDVLARSGFREQTVAWLLAEFERTRAAHVTWLSALTAQQLARAGHHEHVGTITVANVLHHVAFHDLSHIRQIAAMLAPTYHGGRGNMRNAY